MAIRTIQQRGLAYGTVPASITVLLDGIEIYSGSATTVDAPPNLQSRPTNVLFSWGQESADATAKTLEISVTGSQLMLADTNGDYSNYANVTEFLPVRYSQTVNSSTVNDPYANVTIDGISQNRLPSPAGQWYWLISSSSTFRATFDCEPGIDYPVWDPTLTYSIGIRVIYQNACYRSSIDHPTTIGIAPPDDPFAWTTLPALS